MEVTFETAKLAKEKGFNIPTKYCFYTWLESVCKLDNKELETNETLEKLALEEGLDKDLWISQPTQSELQKWLREKHNIDVIVDVGNNGVKFYKVRVFRNGENNLSYLTPFEKYEQALEEGLKEGLKYIKEKL